MDLPKVFDAEKVFGLSEVFVKGATSIICLDCRWGGGRVKIWTVVSACVTQRAQLSALQKAFL